MLKESVGRSGPVIRACEICDEYIEPGDDHRDPPVCPECHEKIMDTIVKTRLEVDRKPYLGKHHAVVFVARYEIKIAIRGK